MLQTVVAKNQPQLDVHCSVVSQWQRDNARVEDSWLSTGSTAGKRALRIGGRGHWLHVPATGLSQPSSASQSQAGVRC